jgi:gamma-glutamyltranspeptidase/glutathione hydrolase
MRFLPCDDPIPVTHPNRRQFMRRLAAAGAASAVSVVWRGPAVAQNTVRLSRREDYIATGQQVAATSTSIQATEAALWALENGGNAADAYMVAALTQTVVEHGLTSIGGAFGMTFFDAAKGKTAGCTGTLGAAAEEPYDFDRESPLTRTGRAMPVPGFIAGVHAAHGKFGKLPWKKLFEPAIRHAGEGAPISPEIIRAAQKRGVRFPEGKALWMPDGKLLQPRQPMRQPDLARVLESVAAGGPEAFYEGDFAKHYVARAAADGGRISLKDFQGWKTLVTNQEGKPEGQYRGYQIWSPRAGMITYALHLNEALDLRSTGISQTHPESVFRQIRIMEEVFLSAKDYSPETHERFASPEYARERADFVLNSPVRKVTLDAIFNTCFLVIRDRDGNCAWGTHSINSPTSFGAGILVDGVYASYAINRDHVRGKGATAPGISTSYALYRDGKPKVIIGSPGYGFVHGPYQFGTGVIEWELSAAAAMNLPRFALPDAEGVSYFESHYDPAVIDMLKKRGIKHRIGRPDTATGLVGALFNRDDGSVQVVQDGRRDGWARAQ